MVQEKINQVLASVRQHPALRVVRLELCGGGYRAYLNAPPTATVQTLEKKFAASGLTFRGSGWDFRDGHYIIVHG